MGLGNNHKTDAINELLSQAAEEGRDLHFGDTLQPVNRVFSAEPEKKPAFSFNAIS